MLYRDLLKLLKKDGWFQVGQVGSHCQFEHAAKKGKVTVAGHPGEDVPPGTLKSILKQAGMEKS